MIGSAENALIGAATRQTAAAAMECDHPDRQMAAQLLQSITPAARFHIARTMQGDAKEHQTATAAGQLGSNPTGKASASQLATAAAPCKTLP
jgi:hypothetical protein